MVSNPISRRLQHVVRVTKASANTTLKAGANRRLKVVGAMTLPRGASNDDDRVMVAAAACTKRTLSALCNVQ